MSSRPDALVLWYPVIDNGPGGYGPETVKARYREFSPLHNISTHAPPTLILLGTQDRHLSVKTAEVFKARMEQAGRRCELVLFPGAGHPLYDYRKGDSPLLTQSTAAVASFLASLGY